MSAVLYKYFNFGNLKMVFCLSSHCPASHSHYILQSQWGEVLLFWTSIEQKKKQFRHSKEASNSGRLFLSAPAHLNVSKCIWSKAKTQRRHNKHSFVLSGKNLQFSPQTSPVTSDGRDPSLHFSSPPSSSCLHVIVSWRQNTGLRY